MATQHSAVAVFVANRAFALTSSRMLLIEHFLSLGWTMVAATTVDEHAAQLFKIGVMVEPVSFVRGGLSPFHDARAWLDLQRIYRKYRPQLIHHFHIKPIILGNLAAAVTSDAKVVNNIEGVGYAFAKGGAIRAMAELGYRLALPRSNATIFLNPDDRDLFVAKGWLPSQQARLIVSTGIDTSRFFPAQLSSQSRNTSTKILMATRLLWQKGVREFVEAAQLVKRQHPTAIFQLAGEWDTVHPDAVNQGWVQSYVEKGTIEFLGYLNNIPKQLRASDIFVLPSVYREGVPRVLLEAAACGLPVITTDMPGCREAVVDGQTGRLVSPRDSQKLAAAIAELLEDAQLRYRMGQAGRQIIEKDFDIRVITAHYLQLYRELGLDI